MTEPSEKGFVHATDSFLQKLTWQQLQLLRTAVRRVHRKNAIGDISNVECDRIIEALGPQAAEITLKKAIDKKLHTMITP